MFSCLRCQSSCKNLWNDPDFSSLSLQTNSHSKSVSWVVPRCSSALTCGAQVMPGFALEPGSAMPSSRAAMPVSQEPFPRSKHAQEIRVAQSAGLRCPEAIQFSLPTISVFCSGVLLCTGDGTESYSHLLVWSKLLKNTSRRRVKEELEGARVLEM